MPSCPPLKRGLGFVARAILSHFNENDSLANESTPTLQVPSSLALTVTRLTDTNILSVCKLTTSPPHSLLPCLTGSGTHPLLPIITHARSDIPED